MKTIDFSNFYFSYSSLSTYEQCSYLFKLLYIDKRKGIGNFFGEYGSFCHSIAEKYFKNELEIWELAEYYKDNYQNNIKESLPFFMKNSYSSYYDAGYEFFKNFDIDRNNYEIIQIEKYVKSMDGEIGITIKPDMIFKEKTTGEIVILDYKTSEILKKNGSIDEEKLSGYKKQLEICVYYLMLFSNIQVKKCKIWFIRSNTYHEWNFDSYTALDSINWVRDTVDKIRGEKDWNYNNSNAFFCQQICGMRMICPYKKG